MKKSLIILISAVLLFSPVLLNAQGDENTIHIKTPKFVSPLLEKWIEEYTSAYPHIQILLYQFSQFAVIQSFVKSGNNF